jgi:hypothetical protein
MHDEDAQGSLFGSEAFLQPPRRPAPGGGEPERSSEEPAVSPADAASAWVPGESDARLDDAAPTWVPDEIEGRDEIAAPNEIEARDEIAGPNEIEARDEIAAPNEVEARDDIAARDKTAAPDELAAPAVDAAPVWPPQTRPDADDAGRIAPPEEGVSARDVRVSRFAGAPLAEPTLDDAVSRAWEGLVTGVPAACPVCHGEIEPALAGALQGYCPSCHVTLD